MRLSHFWTALLSATVFSLLSAVVLIRTGHPRATLHPMILVPLTVGGTALGWALPPIVPATTTAISVGIILFSLAIIVYVMLRARAQ